MRNLCGLANRAGIEIRNHGYVLFQLGIPRNAASQILHAHFKSLKVGGANAIKNAASQMNSQYDIAALGPRKEITDAAKKLIKKQLREMGIPAH
ncbi:MAG: hypothetical protein V1676_01045 [Candidatus Diapherotrites archaeon]